MCGIIGVMQRPTATKVILTTTRVNLPIDIAHSTVGNGLASKALLGFGAWGADFCSTPLGAVRNRRGSGSTETARASRFLFQNRQSRALDRLGEPAVCYVRLT